MSYRTVLIPVGERDNAESAMQAAFLVAERFAGHVQGLHVLPDLANPATHGLIATRMSLEAASSDLRKFKGSAERELDRIFATRQEIFYFAPPAGDRRFQPEAMPGWADFNQGDIYYGFPDLEGRGVGYVCVGRTPLTQSTWHLYWICVHPAAQGRGVGRCLQSAAEAFVIARGGERLLLETSSTPVYATARAFYERAGYAVVGRVTDFYRPGDDCVMYCKAFNQSSRVRSQ